jgi:hypothetical protein
MSLSDNAAEDLTNKIEKLMEKDHSLEFLRTTHKRRITRQYGRKCKNI